MLKIMYFFVSVVILRLFNLKQLKEYRAENCLSIHHEINRKTHLPVYFNDNFSKSQLLHFKD